MMFGLRQKNLRILTKIAFHHLLKKGLQILSPWVRQQRNLIVFTSPHTGSNSRHLYEYMREHTPYRCIWLRNHRELCSGDPPNSVWKMSFQGISLSMQAGAWILDYYIFSTFPHIPLTAQRVFQLWHGVGLKGIALKNPTLKPRDKCKIIKDTDRYTLFLTTSEFMRDHFACTFSIPRARIRITGYPRNDVLFDEQRAILARRSIVSQCGTAFDKVILYAPTWRTERRGWWPFTTINYWDMQETLAAHHAILLVRFHPLTKATLPNQPLNAGRIFAYDHCVPRALDLQVFLAQTDILVTDYSSIAYDFLLLQRPILILAGDDAQFRNVQQGLLPDYEQYLPGPAYREFSAFHASLEQALEGENPAHPHQAKVLPLFHRYLDGQSRKRAMETIIDTLEGRDNA